MDINTDLVRFVAETSRLKLSRDELTKFTEEFKQVIGAFSDISQVKTGGVEKALHPVKITNVLRKDSSLKKNGVDNLKLTKHKKQDYYEGPVL